VFDVCVQRIMRDWPTTEAALEDGVRRVVNAPESDLTLLDIQMPQQQYRAVLALARGYRYVHACGALAGGLRHTSVQSTRELARFLLSSTSRATRQRERITPLTRALAAEMIALALELDVDAPALIALLNDATARVLPVSADAAPVLDVTPTADSAGAAFYEAFADVLHRHMIDKPDGAIALALVAHCASMPLARRAVTECIGAASALRERARRAAFVRHL
jgi:hypothetical protein